MKKLLDAHKNALFALGKIKRKNEVYDYENDENQQKRENYGDRDWSRLCNMKTATRCFPSGVVRYEKEPIFQNNLLVYNDMYYQIGEEHKEFCAEKTQDDGILLVPDMLRMD